MFIDDILRKRTNVCLYGKQICANIQLTLLRRIPMRFVVCAFVCMAMFLYSTILLCIKNGFNIVCSCIACAKYTNRWNGIDVYNTLKLHQK